MSEEKEAATDEFAAGVQALGDVAATAQAVVERDGGRSAAASVAALNELYLRDLPDDERERVLKLATAIVRSYDAHGVGRGEA